jgi:hypothetical protein
LPAYAVPLILAVLVGLLFGLLAWSVLKGRHQDAQDELLEHYDPLLVGLLLLASLAMGVFLVYLLLGLPN